MLTANPAGIPTGGACAFQLPGDLSTPSHARFLVTTTMCQLGFAPHPVEDAKLAVSELATNALTHASSTTARPELWMWARTHPSPELVISIFDIHRDAWPTIRNGDLLDEHGKGLSIVMALSVSAGTHPTRSRLNAAPGKCVWFTLGLPSSWPEAFRGSVRSAPRTAADRLHAALNARGVPTTRHSDDSGVSVLTTGTLNIWVDRKAFSWRDGQRYTRQPLIDLQETAERVISHHETHASTTAP
ncbi:ATP-binding protein [Actinomadura latina]|uniref:Histidine kinase/HSP90-like ATPase domain-containing protein n=1 Tax=Actinomadura latina TaxID=163603 RepID=A0A846YX43_9ACTN|nr:ATP-binding protein [Actinomadura latina]NKZ03282.1 hypothetical protein [Actinomadura latina]